MKFKNYLLLFVFSALTPVNAIAQNTFDYGTITNNIYSNDYFNFTIPVPKDWALQSQEATKRIMEAGKDYLSGDDQIAKRRYEASIINSATLLTVFKYELGSPVEYNPAFLILVENLKNTPGVKSGGDYLYNVRKFMKQSQMKYQNIDETFAKHIIDGKEFYVMNVEMEVAGNTVKQQYYSTVLNGFAFSFLYSYSTENEKSELIRVRDSIKFKK